jgi:ribosomal-protein-alanine N-acetyltransferase
MELVEVPPGIEVRSMRQADIPTVVEIETETFSSPWQQDTFESLLDRPGVELIVMASADQGVIGYAVLWCILDQGELANVALTPEWRGRGLGRHLIRHVIEVARSRKVGKLFLEVRASNRRAADIYQAFGFEEVGLRKNYYSDPREDARIMMATLGQ